MSTTVPSALHTLVTVTVRLRPPMVAGTPLCCSVAEDQRTIRIRDENRGDRTEREFVFDRVFNPPTKQEEIYQELCVPLVSHMMEGFNSCCFAYGQTGSGKTYSIFGREGPLKGILPRAAEHIFALVEKRKPYSNIAVFVSFLEIYLDEISDLGKWCDIKAPLGTSAMDWR